MADFKEIQIGADGQVYQVKDETARNNAGGYTPPDGGIPKTDLAPAVQTSLGLADTALQAADKAQLQSAINAVQTALAGKISGIKANGASTTLPVDQNGVVELPPAGSTISPASASPSMDGTANVGSSAKYAREDHVHPHDTSKANDADVVKSISVNGTSQTKDSSGNVNIQVQAGDQVSVIQPDPADGTFIIRVGSTDYTINLNHTHENMVKLEKFVESNPPASMADDTIYVQVDNITTPTDIEALYIFGIEFTGGGGSAPGVPYLSSPGANISMGDTENGSVMKSIYVKGRFLTQDLSATLNGTGYTFGATQPTGVTRNSDTSLTIDADAAKAGVSIPVIYTGTAHNATATLTIISSSPDSIDVESTLVANSVTIENLAAVKLTGTQWMQTDFVPTPNTDVEMKMKLTAKSSSWDPNEKNYYLLTCYTLQSSQKQFAIYAIQNENGAQLTGIVTKSTPLALQVDRATIVTDKSTLSYSHSGAFSFRPGENGTPITTQGNAVSQQTDPLTIGFYHFSGGTDSILNKFDLTIYELKITDNGTVVRDYKPVRRNGIPGLYDEETDHFISSKTSYPVEEVISGS